MFLVGPFKKAEKEEKDKWEDPPQTGKSPKNQENTKKHKGGQIGTPPPFLKPPRLAALDVASCDLRFCNRNELDNNVQTRSIVKTNGLEGYL